MKTLILFVEDDTDIRETVSDLLQMEGFNCQPCENGQVAWDLLKAGMKPDIIITDIMMPVMDGFELMERISTLSHIHKSVPIICCTASTTIKKRIGEGCICIPKPFDSDKLIETIQSAIPRGNLCEETQT